MLSDIKLGGGLNYDPKNAEVVQIRFRMNFANLKNGKVTIDYIYIGPSALAPK